ncbi:MAG: hypothetical protein RL757_1771, partial [Bacteroidota bacterium]
MPITLTSSSANAYYLNVPNATDNYVFRTPNGDGVANTPKLVVFRVQGAVGSIGSVSQSPAAASVTVCNTVTVTAPTGGSNLPTGQGAYLRYSTDDFATSTVVAMTNSSTGNYQATIPSFSAATTVKYYTFTSGSGLTISAADADWYTINAGNNGGANYSYTVTAGSLSGALPAGTYSVGTGQCFATIQAAATYLNTNGVAGPVVFNVVAGHTENAAAGGIVFGGATGIAGTSATNTITFQKSGAGANPLVTATTTQTTSSLTDAVIKIIGADYMTFDRIDVAEAAGAATVTTSNTATEYGYALFYGSVTNG